MSIIEEFLSENTISKIPVDISWPDNPIVLGLVLGISSPDLLQVYLTIAENLNLSPTLRTLALSKIISLPINGMWLERISSIIFQLPDSEIKVLVHKQMIACLTSISENSKNNLDFIWVIRAANYLATEIKGNSILLFVDCVNGALDTSGLLQVIHKSTEILTSKYININDPVLCWVKKCAIEYMNIISDGKDFKKVAGNLKIISTKLASRDRNEILDKYLDCCKKFMIESDLEVGNAIVSPDFEFNSSYEDMKKVVSEVILNVVKEIRNQQWVNTHAVGQVLDLIGKLDQDLMFAVLNELWEEQKRNFYMKRPWKCIIKSLKYTKVLRMHHYLELSSKVYDQSDNSID